MAGSLDIKAESKIFRLIWNKLNGLDALEFPREDNWEDNCVIFELIDYFALDQGPNTTSIAGWTIELFERLESVTLKLIGSVGYKPFLDKMLGLTKLVKSISKHNDQWDVVDALNDCLPTELQVATDDWYRHKDVPPDMIDLQIYDNLAPLHLLCFPRSDLKDLYAVIRSGSRVTGSLIYSGPVRQQGVFITTPSGEQTWDPRGPFIEYNVSLYGRFGGEMNLDGLIEFKDDIREDLDKFSLALTGIPNLHPAEATLENKQRLSGYACVKSFQERVLCLILQHRTFIGREGREGVKWTDYEGNPVTIKIYQQQADE